MWIIGGLGLWGKQGMGTVLVLSDSTGNSQAISLQ